MSQPTPTVRIPEDLTEVTWPVGTEMASFTGDALVLTSATDFDTSAADHVRHQLPHRHVTHDGDVITVWPRPHRDRP
ncbi:hypothetical protein [Streptomyces cadmiisoli]|uniref:hypothetical protein n=1 Tax=Streptomyces cadmiisoli TaxID=2184053 RepID=UPI0026C60167